MSDLDLLETAPGHIFEHDDGYASIFYVATEDAVFAAHVEEWKASGLSERFIEIMQLLREQGVLYVCFDKDGGDIEGMEEIE